jgi:ABC-type Na+ efflux pump permease subunit
MKKKTDLLTKGINLASGMIDPINALTELAALYKDVAITIEEEKTKRVQIVAEKETKIEMIRAQRDFFMDYLQKTFDERATNFGKLFEIIDDALAKDNIQQLALGLDSLNKLAAESPFKLIADVNALGEALDKKIEFDF